jgi:hypothetical protein
MALSDNRYGGQPNGPRQKTTTGRARNTLINNNSRPAPAVSPSVALGLGSQSAQNQYDFLARLAQLRQEKANLRGAFISEKGAAREDRIGGAVAAEADALQRGITGSSSDLSQRGAVVANEAERVAAARAARGQGMLGVAQGRLEANSTYYRTNAEIDAQRRAEQAMMLVDEFSQNLNGNQQDYGAILKNILAAIADQKSGSGRSGPIRTRNGAGVGAVPLGTQYREGSYAPPPMDPRIARLLREGY